MIRATVSWIKNLGWEVRYLQSDIYWAIYDLVWPSCE